MKLCLVIDRTGGLAFKSRIHQKEGEFDMDRFVRHRSSRLTSRSLLGLLLCAAAGLAPALWTGAALYPMQVAAKENQTISYEGLLYKKTGEATVELSGMEDLMGEVVVPASISYKEKSYAVTSVAAGAFIGSIELMSVDLPDGVTVIGNQAFAMCTSLIKVSLPDTLTKIGKEAFHNCIALASIPLPSSLESIGDSAFEGCSDLEAVQIPKSVESIGSYAFFNCPKMEKMIFDGDSLRVGKHALPEGDVKIFGPNQKKPKFLEDTKMAKDAYQGTYEGENLNETVHEGWNYYPDSNIYAYIAKDGSWTFNTWIEDDGLWYHLNQKGHMDTGWQEIGGEYFCFAEDGSMAKDRWIPFEGRMYYVNEEGRMIKDDWIEQGGMYFYLGKEGELIRDQYINWMGHLYYCDGDGVMVTNRKIGGYYFDGNGRAQSLFMHIPSSFNTFTEM